ncbi:hypothetical protein EPUS_07549 [Endocarpon pusillum Z07020]|uniref:ENTH domain-containing protein n=1 Tax=Endocarpon pusillum (strain Z07020 / HMAS-L-300199) TaxID=1263415 RepID=U1G4Y1_ENDPU|nr:uncharacterized protein EPUS_07549 [Endocarpon pusillum Z07020]ERF72387.1 hypothetical protein EPUS_07549 [Endocarpon pusillum Z07020]
MEKTVKGATKIKLAAPKSKYVEAILSATNGGEAGVAEVFRTLQLRLRDSTWTIVFKSLIITHLMIREGQGDLTLRYIAESPKRLAISNFTDVQTQGTNIRRYSDYLLEKARGYRDTQTDFVKAGSGRLKRLTVDKGLLRETEAVQEQIRTLLRCDMLESHDPDNEITLTAFRLLTLDLLELFKIMNEGTLNVLEHYFEMSRPDAERALNIYKTFGRQTDQVVQYLTVARQYESLTRLEVPKLKHAPTTLTSSLEEYLNDPDFEINRRQYLAQAQGAKGSSKPAFKSEPTSTPFDKAKKSDSSFPAEANSPAQASTQAKAPAPDLIDFFDSIEQNQQPIAQPTVASQPFANGYPQAQHYQQAAFAAQQTGYNPFSVNQQQTGSYAQPLAQQPQQPQGLQPDFTGAGFGGYTPQPQPQPSQYNFPSTLPSIPQNGVASFDPQQQAPPFQQPPQQIQSQAPSTNPFRQSVMPTGAPTSPAVSSSPSIRQSTNPFAKSLNPQPTSNFPASSPPFSNSNSPFTSPPPQTQQQELQQNSALFSPPQQSLQTPIQTLQPQRTGTNPFARNNRSPAMSTSPTEQQQPPPPPLLSAVTGSTNPFRQSQFVHQQTGLGWQNVPGSQGTFGGYDVNHVNTVPIFPRPGAG